MRVALELEFPDEQAASVMQRLRSVPKMTIRFLETDEQAQHNAPSDSVPLSVPQQHALLDEVFGSWQQGEGEEDLMSLIYNSRRDTPREVDL